MSPPIWWFWEVQRLVLGLIAMERLTTLPDLNTRAWDSMTSGFSFGILSQPLAKDLGLFQGLIGYMLLSALLSIA